ncbi:A-kinase anchor protein 1, mitochondrial-like [Stegodyphus dumicola]|uniref:A-kinase anchor protein 1, mitochondrial-like n=1 Tax=Stegodyphus dumicola TaxID=202533 RepID=UPI0015A7D366|nr:A-kinase anchor protein 1, mitochondrial-like [Stegodyphus dumicola]
MILQFTAVECCLGNITFPDGQNGWSDDALHAMEEMCVNETLFAVCDRYSRNNIAYVRLFKFHGDKTIFINRELVERDLAKWTNLPSS